MRLEGDANGVLPSHLERMDERASYAMQRLFKAFDDEGLAQEVFRDRRWPEGVRCPRCGMDEVYEVRSSGGRPLRWKCPGCAYKFTVSSGTLMERTHVPLRTWLFVARHFAATKNGMAAKEVQRLTGIGYQAAWFMVHRLREAMVSDSKIGGPGEIVEVDEAFHGGKRRSRRGGQKHKRGRGAPGKVIIMAMMDRAGEARAIVVPDTKGETLIGTLEAHVSAATFVATDKMASFGQIRVHFAGHAAVDHGREFRRGEAHTNNAESFFSLYKSSIRGTYKAVSHWHTDRYLVEFTFRWSTSRKRDTERFGILLDGLVGRRLFYRTPTGLAFADHPFRDNVLVRDVNDRIEW